MPDTAITKDNVNAYLRELGKEYRRLTGGHMPAEIILIGGASVLVNYGFREQTYDVDAMIQASSAMKEAINHVGDRLGLPNGWLNADFVHTASYSPRLAQYSRYYKTFSNVLQIRTISAEYLVAMKLMSGRPYKYDRSDVVGILAEQVRMGDPITLERVQTAAEQLYGGYDRLPESSRAFIEAALQQENLIELYQNILRQERENKDILVTFEEQYPKVLNEDNLQNVLAAARAKRDAL